MLLFEEHARLILVLHGIFAAALVAVTTHLVLWLRSYVHGKPRKRRATLRFAWLALGLYVLTFVAGNLIYPVYKVRVRLELLENASTITQSLERSKESRERTADLVAESRRYRRGTELPRAQGPQVQPEQAAREGAIVARWFDVKEHLVVLGMLMATVCALVLTFWRPREHGLSLAKPVFAFAVAAALSAWFALLVGLVTASYRAVGAW